MNTVTQNDLVKMFPHTSSSILSQYVVPLNEEFDLSGINNRNRIAAFLAQTGFESNYFNVIEENLNYSAEGLMKTFPSRFNSITAAAYAHKPAQIANRAYAGKNGNGDEASGDGWRYHGRGLIQLTTKNNYVACAKVLNKTPNDLTFYALTPKGAVETASWFWAANKLNGYADMDDIDSITRRVNAAGLGMETRRNLYNQFKEMFP